MSERAKRAAAELERRGWVVYDYGGHKCRSCGSREGESHVYCSQCGLKLPTDKDGQADALADLEAAIVAALEPER